MATYNHLFTDRNHSAYLIPGNNAGAVGTSKIGGAAPRFFDDQLSDLQGYYYFLTIADPELKDVLGEDTAISVFISKDFSPFDDNTEFPDLDIRCIQHPLSEYGSKSIDGFPSLKETPLFVVESNTEPYPVKFGGHPEFVQEEALHNKLLERGYGFLFQIDDNGLDEEILDGDYPFGYGALFVYARFTDGKIDDIVAGFTQF